jgi:UDP-N-acetylmuramyl pentapeptide synthase
MLTLFKEFQAKTKWLVIGDILEQGAQEGSIHTEAANDIATVSAQKIILVGPRLKKYTAPELLKIGVSEDSLVVYESPKDALDYILKEIKGGETMLFKGARFLEGVIEHILADKSDIENLCRRQAVWQNRREKWGL